MGGLQKMRIAVNEKQMEEKRLGRGLKKDASSWAEESLGAPKGRGRWGTSRQRTTLCGNPCSLCAVTTLCFLRASVKSAA